MTEQKEAIIKILISEPVPPFPAEPEFWAWSRKIAAMVAEPGTVVDYTTLSEEARGQDNKIWMANRARDAERMGYDAFIVGCAGDINLRACKAHVKIPVVGATEASALLSSRLGSKFSIIVTALPHKKEVEDLVEEYSLTGKLASVRWAQGMAPGMERKDKIEILTNEMMKAIQEDGAEALIIGHVPDSILFKTQGINQIDGCPVVDSFTAAIKMIESLVRFKRAFGMDICRKTVYR
jgi:allantoin racemase